jgi:hypothetical protein
MIFQDLAIKRPGHWGRIRNMAGTMEHLKSTPLSPLLVRGEALKPPLIRGGLEGLVGEDFMFQDSSPRRLPCR